MGKIIVGYDENEEARDALALGRELAELSEATIVLVGVFPYDFSWAGGKTLEHVLASDARQLFSEPLGQLGDRPVETRAIAGRSAAKSLHELAVAEAAEIIVIGSSRRGPIGRAMPGGVGQRLLHGAPCPVAVAPGGYSSRSEGSLRRIGVGFDGSPEASRALALAQELARGRRNPIDVVGVHERLGSDFFSRFAELSEIPESDRIDDSRRAELEGELARAWRELPEQLRGEPALLEGDDPAAELAGYADRRLALLVVGSRGYGPLRSVLLGGVSSKLLRISPCPILVTPRGAGTE